MWICSMDGARRPRRGVWILGLGTHTPENAMSLTEEAQKLRQQNRSLEKENARLKEENEFLAEASTFSQRVVGSLQRSEDELS